MKERKSLKNRPRTGFPLYSEFCSQADPSAFGPRHGSGLPGDSEAVRRASSCIRCVAPLVAILLNGRRRGRAEAGAPGVTYFRPQRGDHSRKAAFDLAVVLREVARDDLEVELPENRFLGLAFE